MGTHSEDFDVVKEALNTASENGYTLVDIGSSADIALDMAYCCSDVEGWDLIYLTSLVQEVLDSGVT